LRRSDEILRECWHRQREEEKSGNSATHWPEFRGARPCGNTENRLAIRGTRKRS
jgi:hypothetical protein